MEDPIIQQRLAAASAIPPSQRSPEVAAFIECCELQSELARELQQQGTHTSRQQQGMTDLKLTRSCFLSPTGTLWYRPAVYNSAAHQLLSAAAATLASHGAPGGSIRALVESQFSIKTLLLMAAGDPTTIRFVEQEPAATASYLLPIYNRIVDRMQQPAVAAQLRRELQQLQADSPRTLLSYEELLAYLTEVAFKLAAKVLTVSAMVHGSTTVDHRTASALTAVANSASILPQLVPGDLHWDFTATSAAQLHLSLNNSAPQELQSLAPIVSRMTQLLERAQQQGRDYVVAGCGYQLAGISYPYGKHFARHGHVAESMHPPSAFLGWLQQEGQAHARCRAVLPKQWMGLLKGMQASALAQKPTLERQREQGDRWQERTFIEASEAAAGLLKPGVPEGSLATAQGVLQGAAEDKEA
ncbi:hypothetical protein N2152v2_007615 [Parachlorella kessleri]